MPLGERVWEAKGGPTGTTIKSTGPEGVTLEINYVGELEGFGRFPNGRLVGTETSVQGPSGVSTFDEHGILTTSDGETIIFKGSGKSKIESGKRKSVGIHSFVTTSQKYSWINSVIGFWEGEGASDGQEVKGAWYEWK